MTDTLLNSSLVAHGPGSPNQLVSVVIPAYNAEATLDRTLHSVRGQTHRDLEILIVDDGSTDSTPAVVRAHADRDRRVRLLRQSNAGVAAARNLGGQSASSDLIAFIDADDLWAPTKIERQLEVLNAHGPDLGLVYTWFDVIDQADRVRYRMVRQCIAGHVLTQTMRGNFVGHSSSPLIRREALEYAGGFASALRARGVHDCEDWLLYFRIATRYTFALVPEPLTGYRVVPGRMSSDRVRMLRSLHMVSEEMRARYPEHERSINAGLRRYQRFLIREASAFRDYSQLWPLIRTGAIADPSQHLLAPIAVFATVLASHLRAVMRLILRGGAPRPTICFPAPAPESAEDAHDSLISVPATE